MIKLYNPQCIFCNVRTYTMHSISETPTNICYYCGELIKVLNNFLYGEYEKESIFRCYKELNYYLNLDNSPESLQNFKTEIKNSAKYKELQLKTYSWYGVFDINGKPRRKQYEIIDPGQYIKGK